MESSEEQSGTIVDQAVAAMLGAEARLRDSFEGDVAAELEIVDRASGLLLAVLMMLGEQRATIQVDSKGVPVSGDIHLLKLFAFQLMGVKGLRAIRAARASLASGYEAESRAHDRVIAELLEHRRAVLDDATGAEANAWLEGQRGRGIGKRVAERAPENLYADLSADSHADPRPLARLLDDEKRVMSIEPRRTKATRASLLMYAGFARDQSVTIATFAGIELEGVSALDNAIRAGWDRLDDETDAE
jgi:hypothetical protein